MKQLAKYAPTGHRVVRGLSLGLLLLSALAPSAFIVYLVTRYGVDIPFADEWTYAPLLLKAHDHALTLGDLFAQHNEHRLVFPKLLLIVIASLAGGNLRAQMFFSIALVAGTAFNLCWILRRTFASVPAKLLCVVTLMNLLLFSPVQAENWAWGFQFCLFLINYLLTSAICIASSKLSVAKKFLLCGVIAFVASFSFGNGILLWAVTFPIALVGLDKTAQRRTFPWLCAWIIAALATIGLYLLHYTKPAHHPPIAASRHVMDYYSYIAGFLGAPLSRPGRAESLIIPVSLGTLLLIIYVAAVAYALVSRRAEVRKTFAPWFALGGFALLSACLAAITRIGFGTTQALDSRYTSFGMLLAIAVIAILAIGAPMVRSASTGRSRLVDAVGRIGAACLALFAIMFFISASWGTQQIRSIQRMRLWGKAALHFANVLNDQRVFATYLGGNAVDVLRYAKMENSIGFLHPELVKSSRISDLATVHTDGPAAGFMDRLSPSAGSCVVSGWAVLPRKCRVADCVVVSAKSKATAEFAFGVSDEVADRPDAAKLLNRAGLLRCGWRVHFNRSTIPAGEHQITAWAVDANSGCLYQLGGTLVLP